MLRVRIVPCEKLARNSKIGREGGEVALPDGGRVRDLVQAVGLFDEEITRVFVNGRQARLDSSLNRDDLVEVQG
ncbi:MAG: hypothetical protein MUQ26_05070 [Armatimonadetes bacterium]|nr:hypothetical protein [Armatimonadota bacterium]